MVRVLCPPVYILALRLCNLFMIFFKDDLKGESQLLVYARLLHIICNSISLQPETVAKFQDFDQQVKDLLKVLEDAVSSLPLDVS